MTSCEITRILAAVLDARTDRIGVLLTMPADSQQPNRPLDTSSNLRPINIRQLKTYLDSITSSTVALDPTALANTIKKAQEIIGTSSRSNPQSLPVPKIYGHVLVLTSDIRRIHAADMIHPKLQIHLICPGCPPQDTWAAVNCNGWKMRLRADEYASVTNTKSKYPNSLMTKLRAWGSHARSGRMPVSMSDLAIDIVPGPRCTIEHVLGSLRYPNLVQGESKTILVKVMVAEQTMVAPGYSISRTSLSDESSSGDDVTSKIDRMLGVSDTMLLNANLTYTHSLLPIGTLCTTSQQCQFKVRSSTGGQRIPHDSVCTRPSADVITVHQLLATHYASCKNPRDALQCLGDEFGDRGLKSSCPECIESLTRELKYQSRISERRAIEDSPIKTITSIEASPPQCYQTTAEALRAAPDDKKPYAPSGGEVSNTHTKGNNQMDVAEALGLDDAHRIWTNLRNMSQNASNAGKWRAPPTADREEKESRMREQALRNERSIGNSTLRSFSAPMEDYRLRMSAPFL